MPASYRIDKGRRFVFSNASGEITYAEMLAHQRDLTADRDFDSAFAHIADFTYATLGKIFSGPENYGLGRMYETLRRLEGQTGVRAFRTLEDAIDWIVGPL